MKKWYTEALFAAAVSFLLLGTVLSSPLVLRDLRYLIDWWTR